MLVKWSVALRWRGRGRKSETSATTVCVLTVQSLSPQRRAWLYEHVASQCHRVKKHFYKSTQHRITNRRFHQDRTLALKIMPLTRIPWISEQNIHIIQWNAHWRSTDTNCKYLPIFTLNKHCCWRTPKKEGHSVWKCIKYASVPLLKKKKHSVQISRDGFSVVSWQCDVTGR